MTRKGLFRLNPLPTSASRFRTAHRDLRLESRGGAMTAELDRSAKRNRLSRGVINHKQQLRLPFKEAEAGVC